MIPASPKQRCIKKCSVLYTPNVGEHLTIAGVWSWFFGFLCSFLHWQPCPALISSEVLDIFLLPMYLWFLFTLNSLKLLTWPLSPLHYCQTSWKNSLLIWHFFLSYWNCSNLMSSMTLLLNLISSSKALILDVFSAKSDTTEHSFLTGAHAFLILHSPSSHYLSDCPFSLTVTFSPQDWCRLDFCPWVYLCLPSP